MLVSVRNLPFDLIIELMTNNRVANLCTPSCMIRDYYWSWFSGFLTHILPFASLLPVRIKRQLCECVILKSHASRHRVCTTTVLPTSAYQQPFFVIRLLLNRYWPFCELCNPCSSKTLVSLTWTNTSVTMAQIINWGHRSVALGLPVLGRESWVLETQWGFVNRAQVFWIALYVFLSAITEHTPHYRLPRPFDIPLVVMDESFLPTLTVPVAKCPKVFQTLSHRPTCHHTPRSCFISCC